MEKAQNISAINSCSRLRKIQTLLVDNNIDGLLCVLGIDSHYNKGCSKLAQYLFFNLFQENQIKKFNCSDELVDDVIVLIKRNAVHVYCNPLNRKLLLPYITHWHNLCLHCLNPDKFEDDQIAEDFKIRSFIAMVTDCENIGVPYSDTAQPQVFSKFDVEKWPIIQAFANEEYNTGGFFTLKYEKEKSAEVSIISWAKKAFGIKKIQSLHSIPSNTPRSCSVFDLSKELLPLYEIVDPAVLEILVTKTLSSFVKHWETMMALTSICLSSDKTETSELKLCEPLQSYYNHGKVKDQTQDNSPFVLFGENSMKKFLQNLSKVKNGTLKNTGFNGNEESILMVCQEVSPCFPVLCCRTYFIQNKTFDISKENHQEISTNFFREIENLYLVLVKCVVEAIQVFKETLDYQKAEEKARDILQEKRKNDLKNKILKKHLEKKENVSFVLENVLASNGNKKTFSSELNSGCGIKKIEMFIWDIPNEEEQEEEGGRKRKSRIGSLAFGETFVISSIQIENHLDKSKSQNNDILILTSHIPRFHCWRMSSIDENIEEICKSLNLTNYFGKILFNANTIDILSLNPNCFHDSEKGQLHVFEKGVVILRQMQDPICLPSSETVSMETYYKDAFSSLVFLLLKIKPEFGAKFLPTNLWNSSGTFLIVFKPESKARKIFFSQLLHFWRKSGQISHLNQLDSKLEEMYKILTNIESNPSDQNSLMPGINRDLTIKQAKAKMPKLNDFLNHLLVSSSSQLAFDSDLVPILLKKSSKESVRVTERERGEEERKGEREEKEEEEENKEKEGKENKVIVTIISGIRGSYKEKLVKVLRNLSQEQNSMIVISDSLEQMSLFDEEKLQNYLETSIATQEKEFLLNKINFDKNLRVVVVVPGYTETFDVVRSILNHPNSNIRKKLKIGAVTVCINPENFFIENRFNFPILMNQCSNGWVNNVLFITCRNNDKLVFEIQNLIRTSNPGVSFLTANKGKFQSYDFDLILSESAFNSASLCRARNLLYPNWKNSKTDFSNSPVFIEDVKLEFSQPIEKHSLKLRLAGIKKSLNGFPFHQNIFYIRGQVLFTGDPKIFRFSYITLSNQLEIEGASLIPSPPSAKKENPETKYFIIFSGCRLNKETLKTWLIPSFKKIPEKKSLLNRKDLPEKIIKMVQDKHHLDGLPAGWFYNGQQYVCMTGERSYQHPYLEDFLDEYTEVTNAEINEFNSEIEKEKQRLKFL